ncbi:hypothetical protein DGMP_30840 [Desulfomarina profundi]|uniref:Uncharacterized protein n=1 Tax=Desulfomarina profundi TaxID=2772557 RepID=A0A8D5JSR0_9BACT|nr:hypothetical protein [Desulfomarina profundi]BCL62391.1 hypothetical protein DGMP_30840 [Desulfomarina profundi]
MKQHIFYLVLTTILAPFFVGTAQAEPYRILDNNIWVYHDLFVERFGMDPENVDNTLSGARGVAIRLVPLARQRCHQTDSGTREEKCYPSWQWLLDLYIDIDQDIGIKGDAPRQFKPWRSSLYFLARKNPELRKRWEDVFGLKGGKLYLEDGKGKRREVPFEIFGYKRPIKDGLMMIQARINEEIILADPGEKRIIEFSDSTGKLLHRVTLPQSYWPRFAALRAKYAAITEKNWKGGVEKDPHIWVYTKQFARKYNMPQENISNEMEGAMAMAFRMDSWGTYSDLKFSTPERLNFPNMELWDIYLPKNAKLYYADPTIDNFYKGFHSSNGCLHEKTNRNDWDGTYPHLIAGEGLKTGSVHITRDYRYVKKFFFYLVKTNKLTRWYGQSICNQSYLNAKVLKTNFTFAEYTDDYSYVGKEQYFVFGDSLDNFSLNEFFYTDFHKARIPTVFMKAVLHYRQKNTDKKSSLISHVQ